MNKKEIFINELYNLAYNLNINLDAYFSKEALDFLQRLAAIEIITPMNLGEIYGGAVPATQSNKNLFSENGEQIIHFMLNNKENYHNNFTAKELAIALQKPTQSISGSMRRLVADGWVIKTGKNPIIYNITSKTIEKKWN